VLARITLSKFDEMTKIIDKGLLRKVAGGFATGITVITLKSEAGEVIGMTANSFVSISLDPPLVGFCVTKDASITTHLSINKEVAISILSKDQKALSDQFAGLSEMEEDIKFDTNGNFHRIQKALAWYEVVVSQIIETGDHYLIVCKVENLDRDMDKSPLLYYSGYQQLG